MASTPLYAMRVSEILRALETSPDGLMPAQVEERLALYGPNVLYEPLSVPWWHKFRGHLLHPMGVLLLVAGAVAWGVAQPVLGSVIWLIVLANAAFSFWQEYRAEQAVNALKQVLPAFARVLRGGEEIKIPASELVPGDILVLAEGDNIPADARVIEEHGLRANHATLTGDAVPLRKTAEASLREGLSELERPNLVFAGTSVVSGTGRAVVFATGMLTQFGRIAQLTQAVREPPSPLQREMQRITRLVSRLAIVIGLIFFVAGMADLQLAWEAAFIFAIGIVVAVVPEGLLPTVTLSLAMAVQRLAQKGVLVKKLSTVEALGKTSVICTDKSGTLTQNQMTVCDVWVGGQRHKVSGIGYEPKGKLLAAAGVCKDDVTMLLAAADLCNNSRLVPPSPERPHWTCLGDQTEAALRVLAIKGGVNERALERDYPRVHELPFDARRKRMSTVHRKVESGKWKVEGGRWKVAGSSFIPHPSSFPQVVFVKGAPKEVLQLCTHILLGGQVRPLDDATRAEIMAVNDEYARNALRVLALAYRELPPDFDEEAESSWEGGAYTAERVERDLIFLGLAAMMDPPRPQVAQAMRACHAAGIRVVMVTGDYGLTAESLARRVGMLTTPHPRILTGAEVEAMSDAELRAVLDEEIIFARMAPEHKLKLVAAFQARGEVVVVTGDGVNDAPALRKADIGVAMGIVGTDVSKEAAEVILTDDNFAAIMSAIEEGRAVYDNIRKFMTYIFASNVPELLPFMLAALLKWPLALTVPQILAIDLGTDLLPALALGAEQPEPDVMQRPPSTWKRPLLDTGLLSRAVWLGGIEAALCYLGFFFVYDLPHWAATFGLPLDWAPLAYRLSLPPTAALALATTVFHAGVVMAQVGNVFTCRRERAGVRRLGLFSNRFVWLGIGVESLLIFVMIYWEPLARVFNHHPLPPEYWVGLGLYAPVLYILDRIRKEIVFRHERGRTHKITQGGQP